MREADGPLRRDVQATQRQREAPLCARVYMCVCVWSLLVRVLWGWGTRLSASHQRPAYPVLSPFPPLSLLPSLISPLYSDNLLVQQGHIFNVNDRDSFGRTALHYALPNRNFPAVQKLYALAIDQQARDNFGATAHDYAALVRALSNNQFERTCSLLSQFTGIALTFACTGRAVLSDSEFRDLLRGLRGNTTVRTIVLINACVNIREHMEDLLALFAENRNITHFDMGREQNAALPLVIQEYVAANRKLAESGGECDALERSAIAASMTTDQPASAPAAAPVVTTSVSTSRSSVFQGAAANTRATFPRTQQHASQLRANDAEAGTSMNTDEDGDE